MLASARHGRRRDPSPRHPRSDRTAAASPPHAARRVNGDLDHGLTCPASARVSSIETRRHILLAHLRPGINVLARHDMNGVVGAAESSRRRRRRHWRRSGRSSCVAASAGRISIDIAPFRRQIRQPASAALRQLATSCARMSGFSTSASVGGPPAPFLIFCAPAFSTRQSATAAAATKMSAGSAASTAASISRARLDVTISDARRIGQAQRAR